MIHVVAGSDTTKVTEHALQKDRKIISYYMTKNQSEIGEIMDMSQVKVSRQLTKIRKEILSKVA